MRGWVGCGVLIATYNELERASRYLGNRCAAKSTASQREMTYGIALPPNAYQVRPLISFSGKWHTGSSEM